MTNGVIYCNRCGTQNSALAKFCANCGSPFEAPAPAPVASPTEIVLPPQGPAAPLPTQAYVAAVRYGGFWIRFVAFLIDGFIVGIVILPISGLIALAIGLAGNAVSMPTVGVHVVKGIVGLAFNFCASWIYEAGMESSSKQATLGKMALALKVTDLEGRRISFARAAGRYFGKILSSMTLLVGYVLAGLTERKQALHDMIAGTLVIRTQ